MDHPLDGSVESFHGRPGSTQRTAKDWFNNPAADRTRLSHLGLAEYVVGLVQCGDVDSHSNNDGSERSDDRDVHHLPGNAPTVKSKQSIRQREWVRLALHPGH